MANVYVKQGIGDAFGSLKTEGTGGPFSKSVGPVLAGAQQGMRIGLAPINHPTGGFLLRGIPPPLPKRFLSSEAQPATPYDLGSFHLWFSTAPIASVERPHTNSPLPRRQLGLF